MRRLSSNKLCSHFPDLAKAGAVEELFDCWTLTGISTQALKGHHAAYAALEDKIVDLTKRRNEIALKMIIILENAAFHGQEINEEEAERLQ